MSDHYTRRIVAAGLFAIPLSCFAQSGPAYPVKPVRMVVPFPPAGGADLIARLISRKLSDSLAQSFVVDRLIEDAGIRAE